MSQVSKYKRHHCTGLHSEHNQNNHCEIFKFKFHVGIANPKLSLVSFKHHSADSSVWINRWSQTGFRSLSWNVFWCFFVPWLYMRASLRSKFTFICWKCTNVQKRPLFAEFSLLAEERVFSWGIAHAACIFEPLSQQHPCLSMNSVRRRVNLGHCCLPGKRVFSMRQCAIMYNG